MADELKTAKLLVKHGLFRQGGEYKTADKKDKSTWFQVEVKYKDRPRHDELKAGVLSRADVQKLVNKGVAEELSSAPAKPPVK